MGELLNLLLSFYSLVLSVYWVALLCRTPAIHPLFQSLHMLVEPVTRLIRPFAPVINHRVDLAVIVIFVLLSVLVHVLIAQAAPPNAPLFVLGILVVWVAKALSVVFWCVVVSALASWFPALQSSPAVEFTNSISMPILNSMRRFVPPVGIIDFSAMLLLLGIHYIQILSLYPLAARLVGGG